MNVDGVSGTPRGGNNLDTPINIDSISEVKVLLSNYQAEYGKGAGGVVNIVTKGGTPDFHGLAYYYVRNEAFQRERLFQQPGRRSARTVPLQHDWRERGRSYLYSGSFQQKQEQAIFLLRPGVPAQ
jgi:outer membrane receptor protein involved in Fe transport